jgi:DNA-directed RNA polymerase specialized sigma24 family protein
VLGVAEGTVKSRTHRARQALRTALKELLATPARPASPTPAAAPLEDN